MRKLILPDKSEREFDEKLTVYDIIGEISKGLQREAVGALLNGKTLGMQDVPGEDGEFKILKFEDKEGKQIFWHTSAHLMALAIERMFPGVKFAIGPSIDQGFYYDFDTPHRFTPEDLLNIEEEMKKIVKEGYEMERYEMDRDEAIKHFKEMDEKYKVDLIEHFPEGEVISFYKLGEFVDLCRGPHLKDVSKIKAVKLLSIAGAYWRGDENNEMLQRIYGITFPKKSELDSYLNMIEEAKLRDHRKIGKELDLFSFHEEGPGFPFFHPNGMIVRNELLNWWRGVLQERGYGEILTPMILNEELWHKSGHWDHYKENMYFTKIDDADYAIKPMNCPGSTIVYRTNLHSYKEFPLRLSEFGLVHRHELSGALHGLFRVRSFTQDDAHIFCLPEQIEDEVFKMIDLADYLYSTFGFKYTLELSTRPDDYMGDLETWEMAEGALKAALEKKNMPYKINPGDGAFYGPKIDFHLQDAIGRDWQCGTIQLDMQMPVNFDLTYIDANNERKRPVMLHRAMFGSIERFLGILIEHFAGKFPLWMAPVQVEVIPVSEKTNEYAQKVYEELKNKGFRVEIDTRNSQMGAKIRDAQMRKINYMLILGEKERDNGSISVRTRNNENINDIKLDKFMEDLSEEIKEKRMDL
ncbi:threonyl-tRNA synthetase [Ezakiella coagulans]|uniref:Threonine--tRNA ligase n=1 Tax=Ezakiella coagulans TaxID=46507 RepID=A0A2U1E2U3_9FIRM|nr:threonine--tRNA ligase [Ezakiella coagulans]KGF07215.1 threonyl-tRNA synthetase [Tissierellia bacterium S7-1-4]PVY94241.1 threonyl-tRNA synthetase [Ezakiella coagulans]